MTATSSGARVYGMPPRFDPEQGRTVVAPDEPGFGYWVGAAGATYDAATGQFVLYYRVRRPLSAGRGGECVIAVSDDGVTFRPVVRGHKEQLDANSIEKGSVLRDPLTGRWRVYVSYETRQARGWRIGLVEADQISDLDFDSLRTVIAGGPFGLTHIKDPCVYVIGGLYHAFVVTAFDPVQPKPGTGPHAPAGTHRSALLTSADGLYWDDLTFVLEPATSARWGGIGARITSVIRRDPVWVAFFDGKQGPYDDYREQAGVAISHDLIHWTRTSRHRPWVTGRHGGIRYVEALPVEGDFYIYYEYPRTDGSHELRVSVISGTQSPASARERGIESVPWADGEREGATTT